MPLLISRDQGAVGQTPLLDDAPSRWKLRQAVRVVNQTLSGLRLEKHPEKTFIGKIEKGFDFLGYHLRPEGLRVAQATLEKFIARATQLYEQGPGGGIASARFGEYVRRWLQWVRAGLDGEGISSSLGDEGNTPAFVCVYP